MGKSKLKVVKPKKKFKYQLGSYVGTPEDGACKVHKIFYGYKTSLKKGGIIRKKKFVMYEVFSTNRAKFLTFSENKLSYL